MCYDDYLNNLTLFADSFDVIFAYSTYLWYWYP